MHLLRIPIGRGVLGRAGESPTRFVGVSKDVQVIYFILYNPTVIKL